MNKIKSNDHLVISRRFLNVKDSEGVTFEEWVESIESRKSSFTWLEDTIIGQRTLGKIDQVPSSFREKVIRNHSKRNAMVLEGKDEKYVVKLSYIDNEQYIAVHLEGEWSMEHVVTIIDIAEHLGAMFLINGNKEIKREDLEQYFS